MEKIALVCQIISQADIVCCTCIGGRHGDLRMLEADNVGLVVLDEAARSSALECLGVLARFYKSQIALIEDQQQLPPTVRPDTARLSGNEYSLSGRLAQFIKKSTTGQYAKPPAESLILTTKYRMHQELSLLPNIQFYDGSLQDGVSAADRPLPATKKLWPIVHGKGRSCSLFIDVEGKKKKSRSMSYSNAEETDVVVSLLSRLLGVGTKPSTIGVVSPYSG